MAHEKRTRLLVIGSGPAGLTAAIYAARAALSPVVLTGQQPGGQLTITTEVENWPGDTSVLGPDLMARMEAQVRHLGVEIVPDVASRVDLSHRPFLVETDGGARLLAETLVIATGAQARWLGLPMEQTLRGKGVSACATCDGFFFRGREVAVVGGGNSAAEEALFLTRFATRVHLIHRRDSLRADKTNQARILANAKVRIHWNREVADLEATPDRLALAALRLRDTATGALERLPVEGLFIAIGHDPATGLFRGQVAMDEAGYILTAPDSTATSVPGVFAAGDVKDRLYRQAVTAAGMGCMAALEAERFLAGHGAAAQPSLALA
ncbi:thioredoxin-disulfide reductase [Thermaurantiacus sp.]